MPLYECECPKCGNIEEHWFEIADRDSYVYCKAVGCQIHSSVGHQMKRLPGGHGMLYFEEGRGRVHISLGDKPITSYAQQKKLMRDNGVVDTGNNVPSSVAKNPKSVGLKRFMEKDHKGRWL